ncbi:enoyl-CoA hydratase-related protein [Polaromonas sp. P1-6]|nr:enoyl-CoA hydratase-related protein [Polaromonas sp. P1-6]
MNVELKIEQHVATVTLARPDALNAVDLATEAELQRIWTELEKNRDVRVIVLTGSGERVLCRCRPEKPVRERRRLLGRGAPRWLWRHCAA